MKKLSLTQWIFIALGSGLLLGLLLNFTVPETSLLRTVVVDGLFYFTGTAFIRLMKMLVVPLVFCSLVCGAASMGDTKTLGQIGLRTIVFYLCTTSLAVLAAILVANVIDPGKGLNLVTEAVAEIDNSGTPGIAEMLLDIIPENPVEALANGNMLQLIVFSLLVGMLLAKMGERAAALTKVFQQFNDLMMEMTSWVMKLAPVGVFCMICRTFTDIGLEAFLPLLKYMGSVVLALAVMIVIYMVLFFAFTRLSPFTFLKKFFPVMAFAFSTSSSNAAIPINIETLADRLGVSRKVSSFTIPLGATINMDGTSIMQGVAVVFAAQAYGIVLGPAQYATVIAAATLASIGTAGIPSVGLVTLSMVFASVGLPTDAIMLIMGVDRILDMTRTAVNVTGDAVCTTIVASQAGLLDKQQFDARDTTGQRSSSDHRDN